MNQPEHGNRVFRFAAFEVDIRAGELRKHGLRIKLQDQPFQVLVMLLARRGDVVTREELRQRLWSSDTFVDFDHSLNTAINKLREALADSAENPRYIETLPRRGYRFLAPVEEVARTAVVPVTGEQPSEAPGVVPSPSRRWRVVPVTDEQTPKIPEKKETPLAPAPPVPSPAPRRRWPVGVMGVVVAALVLVVVLTNLDRIRRWLGSSNPHKIESIAVLPLENLSGDPEQEYFADGMTDALITDLAQIGSLRVISRTSVMQYKKARKPLPEIARELKVDGIIEGTVQRAGMRVRISVQLLHGPTDAHLWAQEYERDFTDIVLLQREMARAIVEEIRVQLTPRQKQTLAGGKAVNPDAYEAYLKGRYFLDRGSEDGVRKSLAHFQQAIAKDPKNALAYVGLADYYNALGFYGILPPRENYPQWKAMSLKALAFDDTLAEAHTSLAGVLSDYDWDWAGAEREYKRAIELNPNYSLALRWYAQYLSFVGRHEESRAMMERAAAVDPLSLVVGADLALHHYYARNYDRAIEAAGKTLELDPNYPLAHVWLGLAYLRKDKKAEAIDEFQKAGARQGNLLALALLGHAYGEAGRIAGARAVLHQLAAISKQRFVSAAYLTMVYLGMGDRERTFEWLEKSYQERSPLIVRLKAEPLLDPVRDDPRFQDLLRRVKFPSTSEPPGKSP